jgi:hypothetical protein
VTARPAADPVAATVVARAGPRRPRLVLVLAAALLATAVVQAFVLQSYFVPTAALAPTVEPGDRVLVWKVRPAADAGDLVVVDSTGTAAVDRSTPVADGVLGRMLSSLADLLHVDVGTQSQLAVVGAAAPRGSADGSAAPDVAVARPGQGTVARDDVVGTVVLRVWPLSRFGTITTAPAAGAP